MRHHGGFTIYDARHHLSMLGKGPSFLLLLPAMADPGLVLVIYTLRFLLLMFGLVEACPWLLIL